MKKFSNRIAGKLLSMIVIISFFISTQVLAKEKVKIEWLQWWRPEMGETQFDQFVALFNKTHPDIEVEAISVPFSQMRQQIISNFAVGKLSDVIGMNMPWNTEFVDMGILEPLESYIKADKKLNTKDLVQAPMQKYKGHTWMLPVTNHCFMLFYNKDLFKEAGIKNPPSNWDEFKIDAQKLTKVNKNQYGYSVALSSQGAANGPIIELFPLLYTAGGRTVKNEKPNLNSPEVIETLQFLKELNDLGVIVPGALSKPEQQKVEEFASGRAAMMIATMPQINNIRNRNPKLNFGVAPIPKKRKLATRNHGWEIAICSQSKNKQAAWTFVSWLVSKDVNGLFAEKAGQLPGNLAVKADYITKDPLINTANNIMKKSELVEELMLTPRTSDTWRVLTEEMQKMFNNEQDPAQTAEIANKKWEEIFSKSNQLR